MEDATDSRPILTVITPTLNEEDHLPELLESLYRQDIDEPIEILIIDGGSTDATRHLASLAEDQHPDGRSVRLITNPNKRTPFAFNIGLREATAPIVAILGAHANYPPNYLSVCLEVMARNAGPTAVGGTIRTLPTGDGLGSRLVASVMTNTFASSRSSFRTQGAGEVDNIPFPLVNRKILLDLGGYDERLLRNQDNDMNERLRAHGVKLIVTDETEATYFTVSSPTRLLRYAWRNGWWNARTVQLRGSGMRVRHLLPSVFVLSVLFLAVMGFLGPNISIKRFARFALGAGLGAHLGMSALSSTNTQEYLRGTERLLVPPAVVLFHCSYGMGTIAGFVSGIRKDR